MIKHPDWIAGAAAALSTGSLVIDNLTGSWVPTGALSAFTMGSIGLFLATKGAQKLVENHHPEQVRTVADKLLDDTKGLDEEPLTDSWCQFCDQTKPTAEFRIDMLGRFACQSCRKAAGTDLDEEPLNVTETVDVMAGKCINCHVVRGVMLVQLADDSKVQMCKTCLDEMTTRGFSPATYKRAADNEQLLNDTWERLDRLDAAQAQKKAAKKGKRDASFDVNSGEVVAGGEYVRSMYGNQVTVKGVDGGGIVKVDGSNCEAHITGDVMALGRVVADGSNAQIVIDGDVGRGAHIEAKGSNAEIIIKGHIATQAYVRAQGPNAEIIYRTKEPSAIVDAVGSNAEVICKASVKDKISKAQKAPKKPPCAVCGAESYYCLNIPDSGLEHRCVRCAGAYRKYTPAEQNELIRQAHEDDKAKLAAEMQVPPATIGEPELSSGYDKIVQTAEGLTARFDPSMQSIRTLQENFWQSLSEDFKRM